MAEINSVQELLKNISKGKFPQCCFVFGEESFFIDKAIENLESIAKKRNFEFFSFLSNEIRLNELIEWLEQNTLFGEGKIIIVKNFGNYVKITSDQHEEESDENVKTSKKNLPVNNLLEYLKNPNPASFLFLTHYDKIDQRLRFYKEALKLIPFYQSRRFYEKDIFDFIEMKFDEANIKIDKNTVEYIYLTVGDNLYDLESEINRLLISIGDVKKVDIESIKKYLIKTKKYSIFDLFNAFRDKNIDSALEIGLNLINNDAQMVYILIMLQKYFFSLLTFNELRNQYKTDEKVAAVIGCHPFFLKQYEIASKRYKFEELEKIFDILLKKDIELKTLNIDENVLYTTLISEIGLAIKKL